MRIDPGVSSIVSFMVALIACACVSDPASPTPPDGGIEAAHGVLVTNEGLWRQDNATLTFHSVAGGTAQDWFASRNPGHRLGDLANSITVANGTAWIAMTGSNTVEAISLPDGASRGRVVLQSGGPRAVVILDDSTGFVTLVEGDAIAEFDTRTFGVRRRISVGPAPEGITVSRGLVMVAVSGYGFLRWHEPLAGSIAVVDPRSGSVATAVSDLPNVVALAADHGGNRLYALYGLPHADSVGGVVEFDANSMREIRRWDVKGAGIAGEMALDTVRRQIYLIDGRGDLTKIDIATGVVSDFQSGAPYSSLGFYSVGVDQASGDVYGGFAPSFTAYGEVLMLNSAGVIRGRFPAGLNPGDFGFY